MKRVTADQGSQPHFGRVRVGIMRAGIKAGVPTARLALRAPDSQQIVDVAVGETVTVPGEGAVTLDGVHRRATPTGRESVELSWAPADEGAEPA